MEGALSGSVVVSSESVMISDGADKSVDVVGASVVAGTVETAGTVAAAVEPASTVVLVAGTAAP